MKKRKYDMEDDDKNENVPIQDVNDLVNESQELLKNLYKVTDTKRIMTQDDLRNDISSFVSSQLKNLEKQNVLKGLLEAEIAKRVLTHDMSNDELRSFYATISSEKSKNIDSLFKLFVPTQTTPSTILTPAVKEDNSSVINLSSTQRQAIEKLVRVVRAMDEKTKIGIEG